MKAVIGLAALLATLSAVPLHAGDSGAVREFAVTMPALLADEPSRKRLHYLAGCALDASTVLVGEADGKTYRFSGDMALAPGWVDGAITPHERELVSACILARTNLFGVPVRISMRSDRGPESLTASPEEIQSHSEHEGGYFGDLFAPNPAAYVCTSAAHGAHRTAEAAMQRVCAHPSGKTAPDGRRISRCGFIIIEGCGDGAGVEVDGQQWTQIIHVYLPEHSQEATSTPQ